MRTEYLQYFQAVVDYGSINKAANSLFISPQGLSQAIQKLEQEVGTPLFFRDGNKLVLSAAGQEAYHYSTVILNQVKDMTDRLTVYHNAAQEPLKNELCILCGPIIISTVLPQVIDQLRRHNPDVYIQVRELDIKLQIDQIEHNQDTLCIASLPEIELENLLRDRPQALNFSELYRSPLMACVSSNSPLARRSSLSISELHKFPLVVFGVEDRILSHFDLDSDLQEVVFRSSNLEICRSMIANDKRCIGFTNNLPEHYLKQAGLISIPLSPSIDIVTGFFSSPELYASPIVQETIRILRSEFDSLM